MTARTLAWNLLFRSRDGVAAVPDAAPVGPVPSERPAGWAGGNGPGVEWKYWPRSSMTGLPMMHVITLRLPEEYRRQGEHFPGIGFFAGEQQFVEDAVRADAASTDPFLRDLADAVDHPGLRRRRDIIGGEYALLWLTADELATGPTAPRADLRRPGTGPAEPELCNAWDHYAPPSEVWLVPRDDPNAGLAPQDLKGRAAPDGYTHPLDASSHYLPWAQAVQGLSHLGGTAFPVQTLPEGLTPWYLELEQIVGLNFGFGCAQIDLESDTFDWACD